MIQNAIVTIQKKSLNIHTEIVPMQKNYGKNTQFLLKNH